MSPRRIVLAYAICTLVAWVLVVAGATELPSLPYVVLDLALDAAIIVGLWLLWRPAWVAAVVLTLLGELLVSFSSLTGRAVLLSVGAIQLAVLLFPPLRKGFRAQRLTAP